MPATSSIFFLIATHSLRSLAQTRSILRVQPPPHLLLSLSLSLLAKMLFNHKFRSSSPCLLFCCFHDGHAAVYHEAASSGCDDGNRRKAARSPRSWLLSTAQDLPLPEIRHKCRSLIARIGRCRRQRHVAAPEFGYDPMSYALNFEDDRSRESDEEFPERNFSARLPVSPDRLLPAKMPREVVACS